MDAAHIATRCLRCAGLPLLATATPSHTIALISSFYRSGALVFGGGHVVLPLLQQAVVPQGWIYLEAPALFDAASLAERGLELYRHSRAGAVHALLLRRA